MELEKYYLAELSKLKTSSQPQIEELTTLAGKHIARASSIVEIIEFHIQKAFSGWKLPSLYLIDSIVKNLTHTPYKELFAKNIVNTFASVFVKANEQTRSAMYKLRQTWNETFSNEKLYELDIKIKSMDPNWPITARRPVSPQSLNHVEDEASIEAEMNLIRNPRTTSKSKVAANKTEEKLDREKDPRIKDNKENSQKSESENPPKSNSQKRSLNENCDNDASGPSQAKKIKSNHGTASQPTSKATNLLSEQRTSAERIVTRTTAPVYMRMPYQDQQVPTVHYNNQPFPRPQVTGPRKPLPASIQNILATGLNARPGFNGHKVRPSQPRTEVPRNKGNKEGLDVENLYSKLVATGILIKKEGSPENDVPSKPVEETVPDLTELITAKLKQGKYNSLVNELYSGVQCNSCGARFKSENTSKYKEHLDWHFRKNKREKEQTRAVRHRRWYYNRDDWIKYEETDDSDEKYISKYFENVLASVQAITSSKDDISTSESNGPRSHSPVASEKDEENRCEICGECFEQFYNDEEEEWHLKGAVRLHNKFFHPDCFKDAKPEQLLAANLPDPISNPSDYLSALSKQIKETNQSWDVVAKHLKLDSNVTELSEQSQSSKENETNDS